MADGIMSIEERQAIDQTTATVNSVRALTEYQLPGQVAEEVIRDVATWIMTSR